MRNPWQRRARLCAAVLLAGLFALASAQDKVKLSYKAEEGREARYSTEMTIKMDAMGQQLTIEVKEVEKVKFIKVSPEGELTFERETESSEMKMNGETVDNPEEDEGPTTVVVKPNGALVSFETPDAEPAARKTALRMIRATSVIFSDDPVGVGDKWTHQYPADDTVGAGPAEAQFELLAFEEVSGVKTAKIKMTFQETGSGTLKTSATVWVELGSGDGITAEFEAEGVDFGPEGMPPASLKGRSERISGSPLAADEGKTEKQEKNIDDKVKDFEKLDGLFPIYRKKEAGRTTLYMEVREDQLDKLILLQATASTGTSSQVTAGDPINDLVFKLVRMDEERIVIVVPNFNFRADPDNPIHRAVERSFADSYIESFKIEAKQPDRKSLLIDISDLFRGDIAQISASFSGGSSPLAGLGGGGGYALDKEKTYVAKLKVFPENIYVESVYSFNRGGGGGRSISDMLGPQTVPDSRNVAIRVDYNLFLLPEDGYVPRLADSRVGYFTTDHDDYSDDTKSDRTVRYILRWRLEKQDPSASLSPPKKPIVFWLDNAIPTEYRDWVRQGILAWNKAYEKAGIRDAIVVKQMPDDADWDHADMRYNVVRWVTSPSSAYAVALFRANPTTGEILNAAITVDANMAQFANEEGDRLVDPASYFEDDPREGHDPRFCSFGREARTHARFGRLALEIAGGFGPLDEKQYLGSFLRETVMHEMGHILGLRHNFIGSTQFTLEQLKDGGVTQKGGTSGSVMDYLPFNVSAIKQPGTDYFSPVPGAYDTWAIEYGYKPFGATAPAAEEKELKAIASRCNDPGHAYQSDEVADQFDPRVTRFDLSADPLDYYTRLMQVTRYLLFNLDKRSPKPGESFYEFTTDFGLLLGYYARGASMASRYIGGLYINGNYKGDPGMQPTIRPVPGKEQKAALDLLNTYVFAENAFAFPKRYYEWFAPNPNADMVEAFLGGANDYPMRDRFASIQGAALRRLFRNDVLARVANNEFKDPSGALTMATLFRSVGHQVWSELETGKDISSLRRQLQREHLDLLLGIFLNPEGGAPDDAKLLAWDELRRLKRSIYAALPGAKGEYTPVHLAESLMRIERALNARQTVGSGPPPATPSLLDLLLGGSKK